MRMNSSDAKTSGQRERKKPGRVPTSCAECRRLKLRCDRKVPCENCSKRGCGSICPTGSLTTGKGNRLVLTSTAELHNQIESMSERIRELEEALAKKSDDSRQLVSANNPLNFQSNGGKSSSSLTFTSATSEPENDSYIDAFGTLTIGTRGETSFMSGTARSEYLVGRTLQKASTWAALAQSSRLPARVISASTPEHDVAPVDHELRELVMGCRPPLSEAIRLCDIYLEWAKILWTPILRSELVDEIVGNVYRADSYASIPAPHALSLLFSIFALASLFDPSRAPYGMEAHEYYILSRVALEFSPPCITTTLQAVFALANNIQWLDLSDLQTDPSRAYTLTGLGVKLAYRMGLHLHSARFRLEKGISQKRSTVFWQIFRMDTMLSFDAGRPPNVSLEWIETPYPDDEFALKNDNGELEMSWHSWSWRFSKLVHEVLVAAFGAKIPTYCTIIELDRKIRDFPVPSHLQFHCMHDTGVESKTALRRVFILRMKESVLLNIHRRYFSQALQDSPNDPLKHKFGPSVMATYRSAWRLIGSHIYIVGHVPDIAARLPILWSQALSAAIVMCMIVTRAPGSNMAASSLHEVDMVYEVFNNAAPTARVASSLLEHIKRVWCKSHGDVDHPSSECIISRAELDRVGGGSTSLISKSSDTPSPSSCPSDASTPCSDPSDADVMETPSASSSPPNLAPSNLHPRIMQDMQSFDGFQASTAATTSYAPPDQFSQEMMDTQFSQFVEAETPESQAALNTFYAAQPQLFHPASKADSIEGVVLDPAWQSFMEQLGF